MAKQTVGFMGGFQGTLGPAVGYMWNGKWCVRSRPGAVRNPRTPAQVAHREMFKREVQLAANMRWAVENTMRGLARQEGMTCFNLFVKVNQHAFSLVDGAFTVDYSSLRLSMGDVAPVENARIERRDGRVLEVGFDKGHGFSHDHVHMFVYAPGLERGLMSLPVFRRDKKVAIMLPDRFVDEELHVYLMVHTDDGRWSDSVYVFSDQWADGSSQAAVATAKSDMGEQQPDKESTEDGAPQQSSTTQANGTSDPG